MESAPAPRIEIALPDAEVVLFPDWLDQTAADALFAALRTSIAWETHRLRLFGREIDAPRLSCWIGDPDAAYRYSGTHFAPQPWPEALRPVRARLVAETGTEFNSVLANLYRDGNDAMGWHSDDERELGAEPVIASLTLGATRRFALKHRRDPAQRAALDLPHGSLLLMAGGTQRHYKHALPRTRKPVGPRLNLTFRKIFR
jgi:alkylated DNA repair dioxygenase AlkB